MTFDFGVRPSSAALDGARGAGGSEAVHRARVAWPPRLGVSRRLGRRIQSARGLAHSKAGAITDLKSSVCVD